MGRDGDGGALARLHALDQACLRHAGDLLVLGRIGKGRHGLARQLGHNLEGLLHAQVDAHSRQRHLFGRGKNRHLAGGDGLLVHDDRDLRAALLLGRDDALFAHCGHRGLAGLEGDLLALGNLGNIERKGLLYAQLQRLRKSLGRSVARLFVILRGDGLAFFVEKNLSLVVCLLQALEIRLSQVDIPQIQNR